MSIDCSKLMRNNALANCGIFSAGIEADLFLMAKEDIASYNVYNGVVNALSPTSTRYATKDAGTRMTRVSLWLRVHSTMPLSII